MRFHDLRQGAATYMLASGVPLRVAMQVLGHSGIAITSDLYSHVLWEAEQDAADRVAEALFGGNVGGVAVNVAVKNDRIFIVPIGM